MAFAFVQLKSNFFSPGATTLPLTFDSNVTASGLLIGTVAWSSSTATCTVADNVNGSWTAVGSPQVGAAELANVRVQMFYFIGAAAGATTVTATLSTSLSNNAFAVHEYSGTSPSLDGSASYNTGTGTSHATPSITTTVTDALVYGSAVNGFGFTGVNSPFTLRSSDVQTADDVDAGAAGSKSATFTGGANQANIGAILAFKEVSTPQTQWPAPPTFDYEWSRG